MGKLAEACRQKPSHDDMYTALGRSEMERSGIELAWLNRYDGLEFLWK